MIVFSSSTLSKVDYFLEATSFALGPRACGQSPCRRTPSQLRCLGIVCIGGAPTHTITHPNARVGEAKTLYCEEPKAGHRGI